MVVNYRGKTIQIEKGNVDLLNSRKWSWIDSNSRGLKPKWYLVSGRNQKTIYFHREILKAIKGEIVDHKNGDTFDFLKNNLRIVTASVNRTNAEGKTGKLLPKGVFQKKGRKTYFSAVIRKGKKRLYKGSFTNVTDASNWYQDNSK